jgi:hypothetical protein
MTICFRIDPAPYFRPQQTTPLFSWAIKNVQEKDRIAFFNQSCIVLHETLICFNEWLATKEHQQIHSSVKTLAREWQIHTATAASPVWAKVAEAVEKNSKPQGGENLKTHTRLTAKWRVLNTDIVQQIREHLVALVPGVSHEGALRIVFNFDEASMINKNEHDASFSKFTEFRKAFQSLPRYKGSGILLFCVVSDTSSSLANFSPAQRFDRSKRVSEGGFKLYPPFSLVMTMDVWWYAVQNLLVSETLSIRSRSPGENKEISLWDSDLRRMKAPHS